MLEIGARMPSLQLRDTAGRPVLLDDGTPGRASLVFFMRSQSCAICTRHAKDLDQRADDYDLKGVRVLIAIPEGHDEAVEWKTRHGINVPVVAAAEGSSAHAALGLTRKVFGSMQQSGTILVDSHGIIRYAHAATVPTASYNKQGVADAVAAYARGHR